ncbi:unnamed protein product, partial [Musa acuminata subsp. burmannicoides]
WRPKPQHQLPSSSPSISSSLPSPLPVAPVAPHLHRSPPTPILRQMPRRHPETGRLRQRAQRPDHRRRRQVRSSRASAALSSTASLTSRPPSACAPLSRPISWASTSTSPSTSACSSTTVARRPQGVPVP